MIKSYDPTYVTYEELYKAYIDCRRRKRNTANAIEFEKDENYNLYKLYNELNSKTYTVGRSIAFCVERPVKREVFAADFRDRIVHHLLINRLNDMFEEEFIDDSYSCRVGKGTQHGIERCAMFMKEATNNYTEDAWIIKCDLKSFFMTIDKPKLYDKLVKHIEEHYEPKDKNDIPFIKYILGLIVFNEPQNNCILKQSRHNWDNLPREKSLFYCDKDKGIPIGNLTSQIFANFYLSEFDHYITDELGIKYYGRYVDDFFIITRNKDEITDIVNKCREKLRGMGVTLHPKKLYIQHVKKGVKFIGAVIKPNRVYISNRTKGNMYETMKKFEDYIDYLTERNMKPSLDDIEHYVGSMNSYLGFMVHYRTFNIRKKMLRSDCMRKWGEYCYYDQHLKKLTIFAEFRKVIGSKKRISKEEFMTKAMDLNIELEIEQPFNKN
jgi:hypothetical protein